MSDAIEFYDGPPEGIADFILGSMQEKTLAARTPIAERAGKPYCPSSGTEGYAFEDAWCGSCDRYRQMRGEPEIMDCTEGHLVGAFAAAPDTSDPLFPKAWVYDAEGKPSCSDWVERTPQADGAPPTYCGGAESPEQERALYERAMRGEA